MAFDDRIVRVGIEINGRINVYERLQLRATGQKYGGQTQDECEVRISNLTRENRDFLLTEASPFNANRTAKRLIVEAGRVSTGVFRLFEGDITQVSPTQPPDIILSIKAKTQQFAKAQLISNSKPEMCQLREVCDDVAQSMGLALLYEATDKNIANYSYSGPVLKQLAKLEEVGGVNAFIDGSTLVVKDNGQPVTTYTSVLSSQSGMIGIPEITEQGVRVRSLLDPTARLGGRMTVRSELNPAANGDYEIYKLGFDIANRDVAFYSIIEGKRL